MIVVGFIATQEFIVVHSARLFSLKNFFLSRPFFIEVSSVQELERLQALCSEVGCRGVGERQPRIKTRDDQIGLSKALIENQQHTINV